METLELFPDATQHDGERPWGRAPSCCAASPCRAWKRCWPALTGIEAGAPFRNMVRLAAMPCRWRADQLRRALGWTTDRRGYRYTAIDPDSGRPWPAMPEAFFALAREAAARAGFADFRARRLPGQPLPAGLAAVAARQDRNERDFGAPIVSVSLGMSATFLFGGLERPDATRKVPLRHGDVAVWGGLGPAAPPRRAAAEGRAASATGRPAHQFHLRKAG